MAPEKEELCSPPPVPAWRCTAGSRPWKHAGAFPAAWLDSHSATGTTERSKGKGCGAGKARTGSASAQLATARLPQRGGHRGLCTAALRRAHAWEQGANRGRPGGNRREKPTEDA